VQEELRPSALIRSFAVHGGLLLFDRGSPSRLFAYNGTARQIWNLLGTGVTEEDVARRFADAWGVPTSYTREDVRSILSEWRGLRLIGDSSDFNESEIVRGETYRSASSLSPAALEWTSTIRNTAVRFAVATEISAAVHAMFADLETPGATPMVRFEISRASGCEFALIEDGVERIRSENSAQIVGGLWQAILQRVYSDIDWLALIHGGAVARQGVGIGLCGPSGSGKSTLIAALISKGLDYLSDDLIALSSPSGKIVPMPLPLSIKPGAVEVLAAHHPKLAQARRYRTKGVEARLLAPPLSAWTTEPLPLAKLLFPRFVAGALAEAKQISSFEAIERLISERIWLGDPLSEERVAAFVAWIDHIPAYDFVYGDLAQGVRLVEELAS
jgi:Coenzyme PQQ synthesis protein D (PqqD)